MENKFLVEGNMDPNNFNAPLSLRQMQITDAFWKKEMEIVRKEVIPYQWEALNDRVEGAAPSFCMRNFKIAGKLNQEKKKQGIKYIEPKYTFRGFEALPEDPSHLEDKFYGFVFQDSDFSKWIEEVGYSLTQHADSELERIADEAIDIVCAAQQEDGYLDTYYIINGKDKIYTNLRDHHELYCFGHLTEGAVAYYQATGKDKLLKATERFADNIFEHFGNGKEQCKGYPGHEIAEMADVARLKRDISLYQACDNLWNDMVEKKMYVTGGIGGTHIGESFSFAYDLPNDTAYAETCASIGLLFFARRMLEIKPKAKYANVMERALYNGVLSGIGLDGKKFFYVNPLDVNPIACSKDERKNHVKPVRQKWFGCSLTKKLVIKMWL